MATKYVSETKAGKSISAYVILNRKGEKVATVRAHFSDGGTCLVNVFDRESDDMQSATARGYGYDKFTAALSGMTIDGHELTNHCSTTKAPKPPKGRKTFPRDYKAPKGYTLANYTTISKATGGRLHLAYWLNLACDALGLDRNASDLMDSQWEAKRDKAFELESEWRASDDCESGYDSCFRLSGLDYLSALGYRVIQAI